VKESISNRRIGGSAWRPQQCQLAARRDSDGIMALAWRSLAWRHMAT